MKVPDEDAAAGVLEPSGVRTFFGVVSRDSRGRGSLGVRALEDKSLRMPFEILRGAALRAGMRWQRRLRGALSSRTLRRHGRNGNYD